MLAQAGEEGILRNEMHDRPRRNVISLAGTSRREEGIGAVEKAYFGSSCSRDCNRPAPLFRQVRRSLHRLHLGVGAAVVVYICVVSLSGCIVLFEHELYGFFSPDPPLTPSDRQRRLSTAELVQAALWQYPYDRVVGVWDRRVSADVIAELWLEGEGGLRRRLFNPYSGADLGNAQPFSLQALGFLRDAHSNLLGGHFGRVANGIGSLVMVLLSVTAALLWLGNLKRSRVLSKRPATDLAERARKLHRRAGVWMIIFAAVWGATGACFAFPSFVHSFVGTAVGGEAIFEGLYALHSGSAGGWFAKTLWAACGLLTTLLAVTGALGLRRRAPKPLVD
jgi:uncharacterized iron-regulated membrane protein